MGLKTGLLKELFKEDEWESPHRTSFRIHSACRQPDDMKHPYARGFAMLSSATPVVDLR
jgi:hypothetical protein